MAERPGPGPDQRHAVNAPRDELLRGAHRQPADERSLLVEALARVLYPTILLVAAYLLLVGLHEPGGGFAAGLTVGLALLLRRIAGGPHELGAAARIPPGVLLGAGLTLASGYAVAGLVLAGDLLHGTVLHLDLPGLPAHELPTSLVFEIGVALVVTGLVLDILRTLGQESTR